MLNHRKTLLRTLTGSRLYGLELITSDYDYATVVSDSPSEMVGLSRHRKGRHATNGNQDNLEWGFTHFVRTVLGGSTNACDVLFAPPDVWLVCTPEWRQVYENRLAFLCRVTRDAYLGHARGAAKAAFKDKSGTVRESLTKQYGYIVKDAAMAARMLYQLEGLLDAPRSYTPRLSGAAREHCLALKTGHCDAAEFTGWFEDKLAALKAAACDWEADLEAVEILKAQLSLRWLDEWRQPPVQTRLAA